MMISNLDYKVIRHLDGSGYHWCDVFGCHEGAAFKMLRSKKIFCHNHFVSRLKRYTA